VGEAGRVTHVPSRVPDVPVDVGGGAGTSPQPPATHDPLVPGGPSAPAGGAPYAPDMLPTEHGHKSSRTPGSSPQS
jgi:hypothetical protein